MADAKQTGVQPHGAAEPRPANQKKPDEKRHHGHKTVPTQSVRRAAQTNDDFFMGKALHSDTPARAVSFVEHQRPRGWAD